MKRLNIVWLSVVAALGKQLAGGHIGPDLHIDPMLGMSAAVVEVLSTWLLDRQENDSRRPRLVQIRQLIVDSLERALTATRSEAPFYQRYGGALKIWQLLLSDAKSSESRLEELFPFDSVALSYTLGVEAARDPAAIEASLRDTLQGWLDAFLDNPDLFVVLPPGDAQLVAALQAGIPDQEWREFIPHVAEVYRAEFTELLCANETHFRTFVVYALQELRSGRENFTPPMQKRTVLGTFPNLQGVKDRDTEVAALVARLREGGPAVIEVVAPAGFGKTSILRKVVSTVSDGTRIFAGSEITLLAWIDCTRSATTPSRMRAYLDLPRADRDALGAFFRALADMGRSWWIFDNFNPENEHPKRMLEMWGDYAHESVAVVLSRRATGFSKRVKQVDVVQQGLRKGLPSEVCVEIFQSALSNRMLGSTSPATLELLAAQLHHIPKAIEAAATYISYREEEIANLDSFLAGKDAFRKAEAFDMAREALGLISTTIGYLKPNSSQFQILERLSLVQGGLPLSAFSDVIHSDSGSLTHLVRSLMINRYSHPRRGEVLAVHPLVKRAFIEKFRPDAEQTIQILVHVAEDAQKNQNYELAEALWEECEHLLRSQPSSPEREASLIFILEQRSEALMMGAQYGLAVDVQWDIVRILDTQIEPQGGEQLLGRARVLSRLAKCLRSMGQEGEATKVDLQMLGALKAIASTLSGPAGDEPLPG